MRRISCLLLTAACAAGASVGLGAPPDSRAGEAEPVVALPPMIVTEASGSRPWRYAAGAGIEVLARCDDDLTTDLIERNHRLAELLRLVLPEELQFRTAVPKITVMVDSAVVPALARSLVEHTQAGRLAGRSGGGGNVNAATDAVVRPPGIKMLPNLELLDADAMVTFTIVTPRTFRAEALSLAADHLHMIVQQRTPPLPLWFARAYGRIFDHLQFGATTLTLPEFVWHTEAESRALHDDADAPRALMPARDFFAGPRDGGIDLKWECQAELFIRWCLETPERRTALWRFVPQSTDGRWESALQACFGLGAADWRDRLSDYLPVAVEHAIVLRLEHPSPMPRVRARDATAAEIGRIKGEWDRLAARYVRSRQPQFAAAYIELARKSLEAAQQRAGQDPGLFATRGLFELEFGDRLAARPLLEAAAARQQARPRVYVELAAMRLADAITIDPTHTMISPAQAEIVLDELHRAQVQLPPIALADALAAETWVRAGLPLDQDRRHALEAALDRFPQHPPLLWCAAVLYARSGEAELARQMIDRGLSVSRAPAIRARFERLRATLLEPTAKATPATPARDLAPSALVAPGS